MVGFVGRPPGSSCMVCGADLWDVKRYASSGAVVVCQPCVEVLKRALDEADRDGNIEVTVTVAPRVHGPAPDGEAAAAVARAFTLTFRSADESLDDYLEDAEELGEFLRQARSRYGPMTQFNVAVDVLRFPTIDTAEVRFRILMNGNPTSFPFQGSAVERDGYWRVTRETVARILATVGVTVPPRRA